MDKITLDKEAESKNEPKQKLDFRMFIATFKHLWKSDYQKLMIVITIYSGVEQAFITGDFTRVGKINIPENKYVHVMNEIIIPNHLVQK